MQIHKWMNMVLLSVIFAAVVMSWDYTTAFAMEDQGDKQEAKQEMIPEDAIRLRILANSDSEEDQAVKRKVRDQVVLQINTWLGEQKQPASREEARVFIEQHLEELQNTAKEVLEENGKNYGAKAELKVVPFPSKLYGGQVYPAGEYEALRITLGEGSGQNWWCVLFPPLCFVDGSQGTATASEQSDASGEVKGASKDSSKDAKDTKASNVSKAKAQDASNAASAGTTSGDAEGEEKEVRFFLLDVLVAIINWIVDMVKLLFG